MTEEQKIFELECAMELALEKGLKFAYNFLRMQRDMIIRPCVGTSFGGPLFKESDL